MADIFANFAYAKLVANIDSLATSLRVDSVARIPSAATLSSGEFWMTIESTLGAGEFEIIKVTGVDTTAKTMTVVRAQQGTIARSHSTGAVIKHAITSDVLRRLRALNFQHIVPGAIAVANHVVKPGIRIPHPTTVRTFVVRVDAPIAVGGSLTVVARRFNNGTDTTDSLTVTVAAGESVASATGAILTAQGDIWRFDVTAASGSPTDMLLALDAWG